MASTPTGESSSSTPWRAREHTSRLETISAPSIRQTSSIPANAQERDDKSNEPDPCRTSWNAATETVLNEIPNRNTNRDWIWPPSVPNSLPNGIMRDSRENNQEMITETSQRRISLLEDFRWRSRGLPGALSYEATEQDASWIAYWRIKKLSGNSIPNWIPNDHHQGLSNDYREPTNICRSCLLRLPQRSQPGTHPSYHPNDCHWETVHRVPTEWRINRCRDLHIQCTKRLSESRSAHLSQGVWPPTARLTCSIWINDIPPTANAIGALFHLRMVTSEPQMRTDGYDDARSGCSHQWPKSRREPCDDRLFHRYYASQFRRWSLPRVNCIKWKLNQITCQITEIPITIPNRNYTAT